MMDRFTAYINNKRFICACLVTHDCCCSDMGAHVDGFIAVVAHTVILGVSASKKVSGKKANVMLAAHYASEAALRLLKAGNEV